MKKLFFVLILVVIASGLVFADFEFEAGFFGGLGIAASAGFNTQLGYITPDDKAIRWSLLADLGIGYRYSSDETYTETYTGDYDWDKKNVELKYSEGLDFHLGILTEFFFLPFMGIGIGGGFTPGIRGVDHQPFVPYARAQIPFIFKNIKLGIGYDLIFWDGKDILPQGVETPEGSRIYLFVNLRGDYASGLFRFLGAWFGIN